MSSERLPFLVFLAIGVVLVWMVIQPLWQPLLLGAVLATALSRPYERTVRWLRGRRGLAATLFTLLCILLLLGPIASIAVVAARQAIDTFTAASKFIATEDLNDILSRLPGPLAELARRARELLPPVDPNELANELPNRLLAGSQWAASVAGGALKLTSQLAFNLGILLITMHVLLLEGRRLVTWLIEVSPLRRGDTQALLIEFKKATRAILTSTLATAAVQGLLAMLGYLVIGAPRPVFFGLLTMLCAFIPGIGTALVAVPLIGYEFFTGHRGAAVFLAIYFVLVIGTIDNLLKPLLMRGGMQMPGAVVFFSLIGGVLAFGGVGLIAGPLAVTFFLAMVRMREIEPPTSTST